MENTVLKELTRQYDWFDGLELKTKLKDNPFPWPAPGSKWGLPEKEQARLSNMYYDMRNRVVTEARLVSMIRRQRIPFDLTDIMKGLIQVFWGPTKDFILDDNTAWHPEAVELNELLFQDINSLDLKRVSELSDTLDGQLWNWYEGGDIPEQQWDLSDDGTDYLSGAFTVLGFLADIGQLKGEQQLIEFKKFLAKDEDSYTEVACDGDPRYGWEYRIIAEEFGVIMDDDDEIIEIKET